MVKETYTIRVAKKDDLIVDYLAQFPEKRQAGALKKAIEYGIRQMSFESSIQNRLTEIENTMATQFEDQAILMQKMLERIQEDQITEKNNLQGSNAQKESEIDEEKTAEMMKQSLSMFQM